MKKLSLISLTIFIVIVAYINLSALKSSPASPKPISSVFNQPNLTDSSPSTPSSSGPVLNRDQVSLHSNPNDCYLVINQNVYDVSSFIGSHPGGSRQITSRCGKEVSGIFAQIHSNRAWDLLAKYKIAVLANSNSATTNPVNLDLKTIESALRKANPNSEIVNVKPQNNSYIAKIIYNNKLYEVHLDSTGKITKEEIQNDEYDWSLWDTDTDDR